jgi:hypothetical protein
VLRNRAFLRNPFSFLFARSATEDRVAAYLIREHRRGRPLNEAMQDPFVRNRMTASQTGRLLERDDVIHAFGEDVVAAHRNGAGPA